jgi:DNA-binding CsgD family transcriptional regulator
MARGTLVGREIELDRLCALLSDAGSGRAAAAVIRGEPGCGKTALLQEVAGRARADGWTWLAVVGVESEAVLSGAGLLAALTPVRADLDAVPPAQAGALAAMLGWAPATGSGDRYLVGAATLSLLAAAAVRAPVLLTVDDAQWVDPQSLEALAFAARRLGHDRVVTLIAHRAGTPLPLDDLDLLTVAGLPPAAARELLGPEFSATVVDRLVADTGGNPLALLECRRILDRAQRSGAAALPPVLPVPARLTETYAAELGRLGPDAWRVVVLAAADDGTASVLPAVTAEGLDPDACLAEAAEVLGVADGRLAFRHPLLRSAAWARATAAERRSAHRSLAAVSTDRAARAWHRAEAVPGPDDALAAELAAVAELDRSRRGFAAAAATMERAARLSSDPGAAADRLAAATEDAELAGDAGRVRRLADEVLRSDAGAGPRARVLVALGSLELGHGTFARARDLFEQAAGLATGALLVRTLAEMAEVCYLLDDTSALAAAADRAAAVADEADPEQAMLAAYLPGMARVVEGRPELGVPLVRRALELLESDPVLRDDPRQLSVLLLCARWLMDPSAVADSVGRRFARAREAGALGVLAMSLPLYAGGLAWLGDHVRAHAFAGEAVELLETLGFAADPGVACEIAAIESAARGLHDDARRLLDRARRTVAVNAFDPMPPHLGRAVAFCATCRGDLVEVIEVLEDQLARFDGVGLYLEPLGVAPLLVEAYLGLGRDGDARELAARFAAAQPPEQLPVVTAMVHRCAALVAKDPDEAVAAFEQAVRDGDQDRFELARTRLLYGMWLRRAGRRIDARAQLEIARREFAAMELTLWSDRAGQEIAGTGERARSRQATSEPLTSQETRVALLVADGLTNREVAAALFLSPKTVEHHLSAVLRKRGLRSRTELARAGIS